MPLDAKIDVNGCGARQFTIDSSPLRTRTTFVVLLISITK